MSMPNPGQTPLAWSGTAWALAAFAVWAPLTGHAVLATASPFVAGFETLAGNRDTNDWAAGLLLLGELNCVSCHPPPSSASAWMTPKPAPRLDQVAERVHPAYLKRYVARPRQTHPGVTMPDVMAGLAPEQRTAAAEALTHFLLSLSSNRLDLTLPEPIAAKRGQATFHLVGCVACHEPQYQEASGKVSRSVPFPDLPSKYSLAGLRAFLSNPLMSRPGGRMPSLLLKDNEAEDIAHYLLSNPDGAEPAPGDERADAMVALDARVTQGRDWFVRLGCLNCHGLNLTPPSPRLTYPALDELNVRRGCLEAEPSRVNAADSGTVPWANPSPPDYTLNAPQRRVLAKAIALLREGAAPAPEPAHFVRHRMATFHCYACHQREGLGGVLEDRHAYFMTTQADAGEEGAIPPHLNGVGDKLKPGWIRMVLTEGGAVRPYMHTRMPQFGTENLDGLADALCRADRHPAPLPAAADPDPAAKEAGHRLVGTTGLSCILCHQFNGLPGANLSMIDLTTATTRLNQDWFHRFLLNPAQFKPGTRMPQFWPEGRSMLPEVLNGSTDGQIHAIWTYLSDGPNAQQPEGLNRPSQDRPTDDAGGVAVGFE